MSDAEPILPAGSLPADVLRALVEQSLELLAVTDGAGPTALGQRALRRRHRADGRRQRDACSTAAARRRWRRADAQARSSAALGAGSARRGRPAAARRRRRRALGRRARAVGSARIALDLHRRQPDALPRQPRRAARASCSTPPRSSAASACGSARSLPARAAGTGTCSASGGSIRPPARRATPRRSSASIPKTGRR